MLGLGACQRLVVVRMRQDRRVRSGKASSLLPSPTFLSASSSLIRRVAVKTLGMRLFSSAEGEMKQEGKEEEQRVVLFRTPSSGMGSVVAADGDGGNGSLLWRRSRASLRSLLEEEHI
jgi:hypothetical protein